MARVLVVDDEQGLRLFLAEALRDDGHDVEVAGDGVEALAALNRGAFHVVVTDLKMPRMGGAELVRRVRAEQPEVEVIVLTAHGTVGTAVELMKLGAFDFLQKPLGSPGELRRLVGRAAERRVLRDASERARAAGPQVPTLTWGAPGMAPVVSALRRVARTDATVLLTGESGSGKEVAARAVHEWSGRAGGPFVAVNCAALGAELLESELFGHERGAFTGATRQKRGRVELAEGGTFFLDEVGELSPALQAKLLRVLQERTFERVGGTRTLQTNVRWVAATNRDLEAEMGAGRFREDLYHRLAVFPVRMPALRERREDIGPLAEVLLAEVGAGMGRPGVRLGAGARGVLEAHGWPGNVRELRNVLERACILADGDEIDGEALALAGVVRGEAGATGGGGAATLAELERRAIVEALAAEGGHRRRAAKRLGIGERTLYDKLKVYGIK